jgi:predicted amidophosphoribosyltransferase
MYFKYYNYSYLASFFANEILKTYSISSNLKFVPIPISKTKLLWRGYNQSFLLAKELARITNGTVEPMVLKTNTFNFMKNLNLEERLCKSYAMTINNLSGIIGEDIVIVDDIVASGSTIQRAIYLLKPYVNNIYIVAIAKR